MRLNKKAKNILRSFFIFTAIIALTYFVYVFFTSRFMYINKLVITPEDYSTRIGGIASPILTSKRYYLIPASHTVFVPKAKLASQIKANYPEIKSVTVKHKNFQTIEIAYILRVPLFRLDSGLAIDSDGFVYQEPKDINSLPALGIKVNLPSKERLTMISTFADKLSKTISKIDEIVIDENNDVYYQLADSDAYVVTALNDDTNVLWSTLISAITTEPLASTLRDSKRTFQYIDLRFGNKVFYKFGKSGSIATSTQDTYNSTTTSLYDTRILAKPNR